MIKQYSVIDSTRHDVDQELVRFHMPRRLWPFPPPLPTKGPVMTIDHARGGSPCKLRYLCAQLPVDAAMPRYRQSALRPTCMRSLGWKVTKCGSASGRDRPLAAAGRPSPMLRCGPSKRPFMPRAAFSIGE